MVEVMAGMVIPDDVICQLLLYDGNPIGESTLKKHFRQELSQGRAKLRVRHGQALFKAVEEGNVTAQIWWDKTRNRVTESIGIGIDVPTPDAEHNLLDAARRVAFTLAMGASIAEKQPAQKAKKKQPA